MFIQSMNDYNIISISHTDLAVDITVELECQIRYWVIYEIPLQEIKIFKMLLNRLSDSIIINKEKCVIQFYNTDYFLYFGNTLEFRIQDIHKINARNDNTICNEIKKSPNNEIVFSFNENVFTFLIFGGPI